MPVKALDAAKSRLLPDGDPARAEWALAFAQDTIEAVLGTRAVSQVIVVSDDDRVAAMARALGVDVLAESPARGLNAAASRGLAHAHDGPVAIIAADLPCLTPRALDLVLALAADDRAAFVSDAQGTGTTMLLGARPAAIVPQFGDRSRARHRQAGYREIGLTATPEERDLLARAHRDVDTSVDLDDAVRIGVGRATSQLVG